MVSATDAKKQLRLGLIARREAIPAAERQRRSAALCRHLAAWLEDRGMRQVLIYHPVRGEPDLRELADLVPGVTLALPVVDPSGSQMAFHAWRPGGALRPNRYGIPEPEERAPRLAVDGTTAILVPCLALARDGHRLGYGGGFYDRFLSGASAGVAVGVLFAEFVLPAVPREAHDVGLQLYATETGLGTV